MKFQHLDVMKLLNLHDDEAFETEDGMNSNKMFGGNQGKISARILSCLFFTIYSTTKSWAISAWWGVFILIYMALQLLALVFVPETSYTAVPAFDWIKTQLDYITFRSVVTASSSVVLISFLIAVFYIGLVLVLGLWIAQQYWFAGHAYAPMSAQVLSYLLHLQVTVLFMPFITTLIASMNCDNGVVACDGSAAYYLFVTAVILLLVTLVSMVCFVLLISMQNNPTSSDVLASPHGRIASLVWFVAALANVVNTSVSNEQTAIHIVTVLICGIVITWSYIQYLPHYQPFYNRFASGLYSMTVWGGLCLLISYVLQDTSRYTFIVCLLMGLPLVVAAAFLFVVVRETFVSEQEIQKGMSAYVVEVILRCRWQEGAYGAKTGEYRKIVDELFSENAFMLLQLSTMFQASGSASLLASQYMSKSNRCRTKSVDHRFFVFRAFRKQHEEKNSESGALNYMTLKHHQMNAESSIVDALNLIQYMFDSLFSGSLTPSEMFKIANKVDRAAVRAKENLDTLIKLTKSTPRTLLLYSLYASEILFDFTMSKRLYKAAHDTFLQNGMDDESHLDTVTIVISGNEANLGVILDCSDNIENAYGHVPSEVIGINVDSLCPPPINNGIHERFLRHYIDTAVNFVPVTRTVWIRHTDGYYVRCALSILPVQDADTGNLIFQGKLSKVQQDVDFMGVRPTGEILFYSAGMLKTFGLRSFFEKGNGQEVKVQNAVPAMKDIDFEGMFKKLEDSPNYSETTIIETEPGESFRLTISPKVFPQAGVKFTVIDMKEIKNKIEIAEESEPESESSDSGEDDEGDAFDRVQSVHSLDEFAMKSIKNDDETASAKSDGKSSVRAASKVRAAIKVGINNEKQRFNRFRRFARGVGLAFACFAIVALVANQIVFSDMTESVDCFHRSGLRVQYILESGMALLNILENNVTAAMVSFVLGVIQTNANLLESVHQSILEMSLSQSPIIQNLHYNSGLASLYGIDHATSLTSFNSLVLTYVAKMRAFLNSKNDTCDTNCQFVINNADWEIMDVALQILNQYKVNVENTFVIVQYINLGLAIFSTIVLVVVLFLFITPRLLEVKRVKDDVSVSVGSIQVSTLKRICAFNAQRTQKVSSMIEHINKAQNPFQNDQSQFGRSLRINKGMTSLNRQVSASETGVLPSVAAWFRCCCRRRTSKNVIHPGGPVYTNNQNDVGTPEFKERGLSWSLVSSFIKMTIPLVIVALYFCTLFLINQGLKREAQLYLNSMNAIVLRTVYFQKIAFASQSQRADTSTWSRWSGNPTAYNQSIDIQNSFDTIVGLNNMILYGNNDGTGSPMIDKTTTPDLYDLYFVDACTPVETCESALETMPDDPIISSMPSGMQVMMDRILSRTEIVLDGDISLEIMSLESMFPFSEASYLCLQLYEDDLLDRIHSVQTATLVLSLFAIISFVIIFVYLVRVFRVVNNELVDAQSLFLLLPADVLDSIPELNRMIVL